MLPVTETSPLLANEHASCSSRILHALKGEGEPSWIKSFSFFLLGSWLNVLLVFVPLSVLSHHLNWDAALRFTFSFVAIIPLAKVSPLSRGKASKSDMCCSSWERQPTNCPSN